MSEDSPIRSWLKLWPWLAAVLTGVLTTLCFAPFEQTWLCWIALTPLLAAVWFSGEGTKRRWLRDLLLGYVAGVIFFWGVFSWLLHRDGPRPDSGRTLHGRLFCDLELARWPGASPHIAARAGGAPECLAAQFSLTSRQRRRARPGSARFIISGSRSFSPPAGPDLNGSAAGCSAAGAGTVSESLCTTFCRSFRSRRSPVWPGFLSWWRLPT